MVVREADSIPEGVPTLSKRGPRKEVFAEKVACFSSRIGLNRIKKFRQTSLPSSEQTATLTNKNEAMLLIRGYYYVFFGFICLLVVFCEGLSRFANLHQHIPVRKRLRRTNGLATFRLTTA